MQKLSPDAPVIADDVEFGELDREVRARLRTLAKDNAQVVGGHLVMAARLMDDDPELAYKHAQAAAARAGRVDVVREAAGLTAYATGRYADALRELRTVARLSGSHEHLALVADCERGLGRPERAIELAGSPEAATLSSHARIELQIVVAGARADLGQFDAALLTLDRLSSVPKDQVARVAEAKDVIVARAKSAGVAVAGAQVTQGGGDGIGPDELTPEDDDLDDDVVVFDLEEAEDDD